jgi:Phage tail protein
MITMDGQYRFEDFGFNCEPGNEDPLTPNIQRKTLTIPGRAGVWDFGVEIGEKPFTYPLRIMDRFHTEIQKKFEELVAFFFDQYGQPREIKIERDYAPGKTYTVKLAQTIVPNRSVEEADFVVTLVANDPYAYASSNVYDSLDPVEYGAVGENDYYPNTTSFNWIYQKQYSGLYNYSSLITPLKITINGTVTKPNIRNKHTGEVISLPSISNEQLEINTKDFTVKRNGLNLLTEYSGKFINLQPKENSLLFQGENPNCTVVYEWEHKFN